MSPKTRHRFRFFYLSGLALTLTALSSLPTPTLYALDLRNPKYQFQERTNRQGHVDRQEGIRPLQIAGEKLFLVAAFLNTKDLGGRSATQNYRIGFFMPKAQEHVDIEVRDFNNFAREKYHYWMIPTEKSFERGFQEFSWDMEMARELGLKPEELGAVARVRGQGFPMLSPVVLTDVPFPPSVHFAGCRFIFVPNQTIDVEYRLYPKEDRSRLVLESTLETWNKDEKNVIYWRGRDQSGQSAPEGMYVLELTMKVSPLPGRPKEKIPRDYVFYYKPEISDRRQKSP
jgi:hypothetical protein